MLSFECIKNEKSVYFLLTSAASLFLEFLDKNNVLFLNNAKRFSDGTLVAITLMIAESKPEEKDIMIKLVMNLMNL